MKLLQTYQILKEEYSKYFVEYMIHKFKKDYPDQLGNDDDGHIRYLIHLFDRIKEKLYQKDLTKYSYEELKMVAQEKTQMVPFGGTIRNEKYWDTKQINPNLVYDMNGTGLNKTTEYINEIKKAKLVYRVLKNGELKIKVGWNQDNWNEKTLRYVLPDEYKILKDIPKPGKLSIGVPEQDIELIDPQRGHNMNYLRGKSERINDYLPVLVKKFGFHDVDFWVLRKVGNNIYALQS